MEFWSTVTFRASSSEEQEDLDYLLREVARFNVALVESVYHDHTLVVQPDHARALGEAVQRLDLTDERCERMRRGLIKALAFNQHYVYSPRHGWNPADVARRHGHI